MNTATRVYGKVYGTRKTKTISFSWKFIGVGVLIFSLLISAFGVIYAKDLNRRLFIQYQVLQKQAQESEIERNKLLLEQGAWTAQTRVQHLAQHQLGMVLPKPKDIIFIY